MQKHGELAFYVSPGGNDNWSGRLADADRRQADGPFATISRARDAVRSLKAAGVPDDPVAVYIRAGNHQLSEPLVLAPEDSGTKEFPVTYAAYPGENPLISGGKRISGWKKSGDGKLWTVEIPDVREGKWYFRQLFVNGARRYRARLPKKGFYRIAGLVGMEPDASYDTPSRKFRFAAGDLKPDWTNLHDVEVVALHFWVDTHLPIAAVDEKTGIVAFTRSSRRKLTDDYQKKGARYYVDNVLEGLTEPGEWYLDRRTGILHYLPKPGERPDRMEIIAPRLDCLVRFAGEPENNRFVEYLNFRGLTFSHNNWTLPADDAGDLQAADTVPGAIYGRGMCNCRIEECAVKNIGTYGIELAEGCRNNRLVRNEISEAGGGGVKISGGDAQSLPCLRTGATEITDNHVYNLGRIYHSAVGIFIRHSAGNNISHNHVHHLYYTGISAGWVWGYEESVSRDNRIEFNHIHDIGQGLLSDMGGIYTLGVSPGTVVKNNLIYNVRAHGYGGWAIYPDEGSSHLIIENNICYDTSHAVFHQHYGRENIVRNNILAFGGAGQVVYSRAEDHLGFTFERNIVLIADRQPLFSGSYKYRDLKMRKFTSDLNLFWDVSGKEPVCWSETPARTGNKALKWADWRRTGHDLHSVIADPGCRDWRKRKFDLKENSPAEKIGFQPFSLHRAGPRRKPKQKG